MLEGSDTKTLDTLPAQDSVQELRDLLERMRGELKFKQAKIEALNFEVARLKRWRFGSSSESLRVLKGSDPFFPSPFFRGDGPAGMDRHGLRPRFCLENTNTVYNLPVHVIAKPALVEFWEKHPEAESPLQAWYRTMESGVFTDFNDLRATFASADYVDGLTVFNTGGNKYRLIASMHYNRHKVFIRAVLTHAEYDRGDWKRRK